ncbi:TRAP transporter large permease subunit [Amylibacter sp. SFDW26]|uniref:TRAP transporter large permease subunit n=1 Tax=Amylibacter sp. SFDW26 TaxID=2652722 RepID=UPI001262862E|nr:TRAP transporter large permease subunit [Amylibacter sp. SFDW26]KAB7610046.1 TRAP transporter large permease subunit [Amylibacter sp. SFDW26]
MAEEEIPENLEITDELIAERRAEEPGETPEDMTSWQRPITGTIDVINMWAGKIICLLLVPLIFAMVFEVVSRKAFAVLSANDMADLARSWGLGPTLWAYDISRMSGGILFMGAAGYALMRGVHIRADFLYRNWSSKTQATVDAALYLAFYFPAMLFFFWSSYEYGLKAFGGNIFDTVGWERASDSTWAPYVGPARAFMPIGAFLLLLQGFPELFRAFHQMGKERESKFLKLLPFYFVALAAVFVTVYYPNVSPIDDWFAGIFGGSDAFSFSKPTIGLFMLAAMLFAIFVGFPISFTLIFLAFVFGTWGTSSKLTFFLMTLQTNAVMLDDQLVAVPLFTFMGIMMEQAGLMERLFRAVQLMMSRTRGALYVAVLFVSTIFAAATGIVGASVTILGIMAGKTMNRSGYNVRLAAGTITAGGTLGILIPPSIMLIVMGPVLEVPVTDLFRAAILPGIMLASLYLVYSLGRCLMDSSLGPILPVDEQPETSPYYPAEVAIVFAALFFFIWLCIKASTGALAIFPFAGLLFPIAWIGIMYAVYNWTRKVKPGGFYFSDLWYEFFMGLVPPTVLIAFALGSILAGWATPAEAAACGALGSIILSVAYKKFTTAGLYDALIKTLELSVLIMFLVAASNFFGAVFSNLGTPKMLTELLLSLDMSPIMMLILIMALIFLLGWPLEWVPIVLIIIPILVPTVLSLDLGFENEVDMLTWFAILVAVNLQTAWLSPPVALSAYFLKGVVPEWDLKDIYLGMMQFMCIQMLGLILIFIFPEIALWLPEYLSGSN